MKKIYTMLTAALFGVASLSAAQLATPNKGLNALKLGNLNELKVNGELDQVASIPSVGLRPAPPSGGDEEVADVAGNWVLAYDGDEENTYEYSSLAMQQEKGSKSVVIKNFIMSGTNDIPATLGERLIDGSYYTTLTFAGNGKLPLYTYNGKTYMLWLFGYDETGKPGLYTNDLEFIKMGDEFVFAYTDCAVAWVTSDGYGSWAMNPGIIKSDSSFSGQMEALDNDGNTVWIDGEEAQVIITSDDLPNAFGVMNFAGFGGLSVFQYDVETKQVVSLPNQCEVTVSTTSGSKITLYGTSNRPANGTTTIPDYVITGTLEGTSATTAVVKFPQWYIANWSFGAQNGGYEVGIYTSFRDSQMTLPFNPLPDAGGVEGVVAEKENAPVEYYNLQGVRVMNPEAGQLVIKRQGSEVKKMVIR